MYSDIRRFKYLHIFQFHKHVINSIYEKMYHLEFNNEFVKDLLLIKARLNFHVNDDQLRLNSKN